MDIYEYRMPVALMGKEVLDRQLPTELNNMAVSLIVSAHMFTVDSTRQLGNLLAVCPNLQHLRFSGRSLLSLSSFVGRSLPNIRKITLSSDRGLSVEGFASVLNMVPNLSVADQLPPTLYALDVAALDEKRLDRLSLEPWHRTALSLLFSRQWTTRHLTMWVAPLTWEYLEELEPLPATVGLPGTRSLTLILSTSRDGGPSVLLPLILACRLSRLDLRAKADDLTDLLSVVLAECRSLHTLKLRIFTSPPAQIMSLVDVLSAALPGTLRSLSFSSAATQADVLHALGPPCRAHRIIFTLKQ